MKSVKLFALAAVASMMLVGTAAGQERLALLVAPKPAPYQTLIEPAKCPQKNLRKCMQVCRDKYKGSNCENWCRGKGCK